MSPARLQQASETVENASDGSPVLDPFHGYFDREGPIPEGVDPARSRPWFDLLGWGVPAGLYTYQRTLEGRSGARVR